MEQETTGLTPEQQARIKGLLMQISATLDGLDQDATEPATVFRIESSESGRRHAAPETLQSSVVHPASSILNAGAAQLASCIRQRELSPVEVTEAMLARIQELNPTLNAYITVLADAALEAARAAEGSSPTGLLHGVPVSLKDLFATRGIRTTAGSRILTDWYPDTDATVTERLHAAGAILLGKTNMHEFAYGIINDNPHYGPARNPWDHTRITGGSSGGSASAVAAGMCAASIGTDTGGSIRIPAAFCGIVGLKPTYGRVSRAGVTPLSWSLDHIGPMVHCVEDAALLLQVIAGKDERDPSSSPAPVPDYMGELQRNDVSGLRVGIIRDYSLTGIHPDVEAATRATIQTLEGLGVSFEEVQLSYLNQANTVGVTIVAVEGSTCHDHWLRERAADYGGDVRTLLTMGQHLTGTQYLQAQRLRSLILADIMEAFKTVDVLLTPAVSMTAPRLEDVRSITGMDEFRATAMRYIRLFNLTGIPCLIVPSGLDSNGLPIGVQLAGRPFDEATLLQLGYVYEQARGNLLQRE